MIFINSDTQFIWRNMQDEFTFEYIVDATVVGTLYDTDGTLLATFNFDCLNDGCGNYKGTLLATNADLDPCGEYIVEVVATRGGQTERRRETHNASYRGFN